jgi:hypothetical protein
VTNSHGQWHWVVAELLLGEIVPRLDDRVIEMIDLPE